MADAELLLTIDGTDVTTDVWQWASVTYSDAWDQHPALQFTLRQPYGSVGTYAAYDDVRLRNLLTGVILFEGIIQPGELVQTERDPGWVESQVRCVGYQALFDTSRVAQDFSWTGYADYAACPNTATSVEAVIAASFGDARVQVPVTLWPYTPSSFTDLWLDAVVFEVSIGARSATLTAAIDTLLGQSLAESAANRAGGTGSGAHPYLAKLIPGMGLALTTPDTAVRGAAPVTLTAASFGRPSSPVKAGDTGDIASHSFYTLETDVSLVDASGTWPTNGYVVFGPDRTFPELPYGQFAQQYWTTGPGRGSTSYRLTSPLMPHDVLVGHELTFDTPWLGSVTGVVQQVQTTFSDGVYEAAAASWPFFLDGTKTLDGTWELDDTTSRSIPRRMRRSTIMLASGNSAPATAKRTVSKLRRGTF